MKNSSKKLLCVLIAGLISAFLFIPLLHAAAETQSGRIVAIVVAVTNANSTIPEITRLPYTANDAKCVLQALSKWSYDDCKIDKLIEGESDSSQPSKKNIMDRIPQWLDEAKAEDTVIVFFSGHGITQDADGQANYLVPSDVNEKDLAGSSVPIQWLRKELGRCKARSKFLFLDCCHAGGEGTANSKIEPTPEAQNFEGTLKSAAPASDILDVVTIAACGAGEKSHYWKTQNVSLFSYYLSEALRGGADSNRDHQITLDELFKYVYDNVRKTATDLGFVQNPVRIVRSGVSGDPVVVKTSRPEKTLDECLEDIARQIAATMQQKGIKTTGTLEFFASTQDGKEMLAKTEFGLLAINCAEKLQDMIPRYLPSGCGYQIVRRQMIESKLRDSAVTTEEVFSGKMAEIVGTVKFIDKSTIASFVVGKIARTDQNGGVHITCEMSGLPNMTVLGSYSGQVRLSQAEIATSGDWRPNKEEKFGAVGPAVDPNYRHGGLTTPRSDLAPMGQDSINIPSIYAAAAPLVALGPNEARLFQVTFEVRRGGTFQPARMLRIDGRLYVALERGDVYRIRIKNPLPEPVMVRLLVDGLNTLPEKIVAPPKIKFVAVSTDDDMEYIESLKATGAIVRQDKVGDFYQVAAPRGLDDARSWKFAPGQESVIPGFFHEVGAGGNYTEFKVVDAPFSIAGQTRFDTHIGLINIGFFKAVDVNAQTMSSDGTRAALGTGQGKRVFRSVGLDPFVMPGGILEMQQYYYAPLRVIDPTGRLPFVGYPKRTR